jgi:putative endonuclease
MFENKNKQIIGRIGEELAVNFLIKSDYLILKRNFRRKSDEIDIIGISPTGVLIFFEVKSFATVKPVTGFEVLTPEDNLTRAKLRRISRTCEFFAREHPELIDEERGWQIDLLAVDIGQDGRASDIRHYENI